MRKTVCVCAIVWAIAFSAIGFADESLTLHKALEIARQNNPQFLMSEADVGIAAARLEQAKAYPNPSIDFGMGRITDTQEVSSDRRLIEGEIAQEVELWGKRGLRKKIAKNDIVMSEQRRILTWQEMALSVKDAYYRLLLEKELLGIAGDNLDIGKKFLGSTELKFQQNEVPYSDVLRARLELVRLRSDVLSRQAELEIQKHALNTLLGRTPETQFQLAGRLRYRPLKVSLDTLVEQAIGTRPELKLVSTQIEQADQRRRLAKRRGLPNPTLRFWGEQDGPEVKLGGGLGFEIPLWYRQGGEIREAEQLKLRSEIEQGALGLEIEREVRNAYRELQKSGEELAVKREGIEASAELIRTSFQSYQEGRTSFLKFLETMRSVNEFKIDYYTTLALWHRRRAVLEKAIGSDL